MSQGGLRTGRVRERCPGHGRGGRQRRHPMQGIAARGHAAERIVHAPHGLLTRPARRREPEHPLGHGTRVESPGLPPREVAREDTLRVEPARLHQRLRELQGHPDRAAVPVPRRQPEEHPRHPMPHRRWRRRSHIRWFFHPCVAAASNRDSSALGRGWKPSHNPEVFPASRHPPPAHYTSGILPRPSADRRLQPVTRLCGRGIQPRSNGRRLQAPTSCGSGALVSSFAPRA